MCTNEHRFFWLASAFCLATSVPLAFANFKAQGEPTKQIEVKLTPKSKTVRVGESLEVRVEVWNVGSEELFIEKRIYEPCIGSPLSFSLVGGPPLNLQGLGAGCAADFGGAPRESPTTRLLERWVSLPVGHFYGTVVRLFPDFFPQLWRPGQWYLHGTYSSEGDLLSSVALNHVPSIPDQTAMFPYKGWKGEEEANVVQIEVVRPRRSVAKKN
jgi:hypothetical protein